MWLDPRYDCGGLFPQSMRNCSGRATPWKKTSLGEERARVLIVDDTPEVRAFVSEALRTFGYEVHTAAGANEALGLMARARFELLLCDLRLSGVRGTELVEKVRRLDPELAVIILTGVPSDDHDVRRLRENGIAVLHKPVQLARLHTAVVEVLRTLNP